MATPVLDVLVGGILPHVHFKKVIVEGNNPADLKDIIYKITVQMELYQRKDEILTKSWLKDLDLELGDELDSGGPKITSLFDFFKLNIVQTLSPKHINMMRKSNPLPDNEDDATWNDNKSIFLHKALSNNKDPFRDPLCFNNGHAGAPTKSAFLDTLDLNLSNVFTDAVAGNYREEIYKGKVYYAIPREYITYYTPAVEGTSFGIAAYTSLDLAGTLGAHPWTYVEQLNMEGPISAEVIFKGGKIPTTREVFVDLSGRPWSGPVHYHGPSSPTSAGYTGYMTGEFHTPDQAQEKLSVATMTNTLVHDFVDPFAQKVPDQLFQMVNGVPVITGADDISNIGPNYQKIEKELGVILSPLQKEAKKSLLKSDATPYSKLYITRDRNGSAHGMFYLDIYSMLMNNSQFFPYLSTDTQKSANTFKIIANNCKIIELSVKRVRVDNTYGINGYEEFQDDKAAEQPPRVVACLRDKESADPGQTELTYQNGGKFEEKFFSNVADVGNRHSRFFAFYDHDIASQTAGSYRYQVELIFFDGTQHWMRTQLKKYMDLKTELEAYYKLSLSHVKFGTKKSLNVNVHGEDYVKSLWKPYYDSRYKRFAPEFAVQALELFKNFANKGIWDRVASAIVNYRWDFNVAEHRASQIGSVTAKGTKFEENILKLMQPGPEISGSPDGILICLNILKGMCSRLEGILGGAKKNKPHQKNIYQTKVKTDDYQQLPMQLYEATKGSTTRALIEESHSWDHPNEIFRVYPNKDVFIDYLAMHPGMIAAWNPTKTKYEYYEQPPAGAPPIRRIGTAYFKRRCKADLAKYTKYAFHGGSQTPANDNLLDGVGDESAFSGDGGDISPYLPNGSRMTIKGQKDYFSRQLYSYLTPATIELSDPTNTDVSWGFRYRAFNANAFSAMETPSLNENGGPLPGSDIYSSTFKDKKIQESILVSFANYTKSRNELGHADLSNPLSNNSDFFNDAYLDPEVVEAKGLPTNDVERREAYKSFFAKHNVTIHELDKHSTFFGTNGDKEGGSIGTPEIVPPGAPAEYPYTSKDYSDGMARTGDIFSKLVASPLTDTEIPHGQVHLFGGYTSAGKPMTIQMAEYNFDFPNVYKMAFLRDNWKTNASAGDPGLNMDDGGTLSNLWSGRADLIEFPEQNNASVFFNFNMVAKIEKFMGYGKGTSLGSLAVDDKWALLKKEDVNSTKTSLFCRISYYDAKLVGKVDSIPVLDRYFILSDSVEEYNFIAPIPPVTPPSPVDSPGLTFDAINNIAIAEFMQAVDKGMLEGGALPVMPVSGLDQFGQPSPIDMTTTATSAMTTQGGLANKGAQHATKTGMAAPGKPYTS